MDKEQELRPDLQQRLVTALYGPNIRRSDTVEELADALIAVAASRRSSDEQAEVVGWPITAESYVYEFVRRGEKNTRKLAPWEQAYQDADLIEAARRHGYINIAGNVACDVTVTDRGRWIAEIYGRALYAPPAVAAGGVTEALDAAREWINASGHAEHCFTNDPNPDACRCVCGKDSLIEQIDDAAAALAVGDEGIREGAE